MSFDSLLNDNVVLLKKNGESHEAIKASVQKNKIFIEGSDQLIESGDLIKHRMSNGAVETYKVIDPGFHEEFHGIPAGYQMDVQKLGLPEAERAVQSITYNLSGPNVRINQNSVDNSVNINNTNQALVEQIQALRNEVKQLNLGYEQENEALEIINAIEDQTNSGNPSKAAVKSLIRGLPSAGNIASIGSFIVSLMGVG